MKILNLNHAESARYLEKACANLKNHCPNISAHSIPTRKQKIIASALALILIGTYHTMPYDVTTAALILFSVTIPLPIMLTLWATSKQYDEAVNPHKYRDKTYLDISTTEKILEYLKQKLPIYTVAVPLYDEEKILPDLIRALEKILYPQDRIQILIILEEDDTKTQNALRKINTKPQFETVIVPKAHPRTKPKALAYALNFAKGEYITVYDAEDTPEPTQLLRAIHHFRNADPDVVCLQAQLNIINGHQNWITSNFQFEYAYHFICFIRYLTKQKLAVPLGGSSNHFKTNVVRKIGNWDPYNVTEDADLGIRIARAGLRIEMLNAITYEKAPHQIKNWMKQRTRWIKGWMQTWCVHMRNPIRLYNQIGIKSFIIFQIYMLCPIIARMLSVFFFLISVKFLILTTIPIPFKPSYLQGEYQNVLNFMTYQWILFLAVVTIAFAVATILVIYSPIFMTQRPNLKYLFTLPLYWICITICNISAIIELIRYPSRWNKTIHD